MTKRWTAGIMIHLALLLPAHLDGAGALVIESGEKQTALVELYSSEGCSSCPPADAWMNELKHYNGLWKDLVPVAFHVDYWDYLGWKDPYASSQYTQRQRDLVRSWNGHTLYTPGVVLNGREWRDWHSARNIASRSEQRAGILRIETLNPNRYKIDFTRAGDDTAPLEAHAVVLSFNQVSHVKSGENRGRTLKHEFVAIEYQQSAMSRENDVWQATIEMKPLSKNPGETFAIAVWVSPAGDPAPLQCAGAYLN